MLYITNYPRPTAFIVFIMTATGLLKSQNVHLSEEHIRSYTKQLLEGVNFLHENKILHRDIKSANILVTAGNVLKIADWGLARFYERTNHRMTVEVVTLWYRSPELLCGVRRYGPEIDLWSVGCIFGEMKTTQPILAIKDNDASRQMELLWNECGTPTGDVLKKYESYPLWESCKFQKQVNRKISQKYDRDTKKWDTKSLLLLERFLDFDPETRISAVDALNDDYFTSRPVKAPDELQVFERVDCPRHMDAEEARKKQKEEYEKEKSRKEKEAKARADKARHEERVRMNVRLILGGLYIYTIAIVLRV